MDEEEFSEESGKGILNGRRRKDKSKDLFLETNGIYLD